MLALDFMNISMILMSHYIDDKWTFRKKFTK